MKFHEETRSAIAHHVQQGIESGEILPHANPRLFAIDYFSQIFGCIYQWLISPEEVSFSDSIRSLRALCLYALTKAESDYKDHN